MKKRQTKTQSQSKKFKQVARKLGADESDDALDRAIGRLKLKDKAPTKRSASDQEDNSSPDYCQSRRGSPG